MQNVQTDTQKHSVSTPTKIVQGTQTACNHVAECVHATKDAVKMAAAGSTATGTTIAGAGGLIGKQAMERVGAAITTHCYYVFLGYPATYGSLHALGQVSLTGARYAPFIIPAAAGIACLPLTPVGAAYCASSYAATSLGFSLPATAATTAATFLASGSLPESWSVVGTRAYELINQTAQASTSSEVEPTNNTESNQAPVESSNNNSVPGGQPSSSEENGNPSPQDTSEPKASGVPTTVETVFSTFYSFFRPSPPQKAEAIVHLTPVYKDNKVEVKVRIDASTLCR